MGIEREIKLALPSSLHDEVVTLINRQTGTEGRKINLTNVYFDTPAHTLAKAKNALRLRGLPDHWLQTYKTAGESQDGMHSRHEWEMPVAGEALEIDALLQLCDDEQARDALRDSAPDLAALFRTDFSRVIWDIEHEGAMIEVALDLGEIVTDVDGERRTAPISELELELKSGGEQALNDLAALMRGAFTDLQPENLSKARRGYDLCTSKDEEGGQV